MLTGTLTDPAIRDTLARTEAVQGDDHVHTDMIKHRIAMYKRLKNTHYYRVISELLDPMIKNLECLIAKPRGAFPDVPSDILDEQRAEWRGMLGAYVKLRDEPHLLEEQLRQFQEHKQKENAIGDEKELKEDKYV